MVKHFQTELQPSDSDSTLSRGCFNMNFYCTVMSHEKNIALVCTKVELSHFLHISVCSNDLRVYWWLQMLEDCCSSIVWWTLYRLSIQQLCICFILSLFSLCFVFGSLCCLTLYSHQSCCCLWIAVLLWSKADLAAEQQACLWVLATMHADLLGGGGGYFAVHL